MSKFTEHPALQPADPIPRGNLTGLKVYWKKDLLSGFLVFLVALPLSLGIAGASGFPPIAGVLTAIVGGLLTGLLSNSELTIKGPAAGLIVIAAGAIAEFSATYGPERAYQLALGVGVAAGILQILLGLLRTGILGEFFPTSAVHGMLAAIGVIIVAKQIHLVLGVMDVNGETLELIAEIPASLQKVNPEIALIGLVSLGILFGWSFLKNRYVRMVPAPMVVVLLAVPLGMAFDLSHEHTYSFLGHDYSLSERFLVDVPANMFNAITFPDFEALASAAGWKWVVMFALIGSLESLLSAKAIDMLDPHQRKTNLDRDMLAIGVGNTLSASIGGLPMISEIVRSKANIDNGAKTRFAELWHGMFLLLFVAQLPGLIHRIPLAALAAMLVYTGFRLASPREFVNVYKIGKEQLVIFASTMVAVLATDLLIGIGIGIGVKMFIHVLHGAPVRSLFRPYLDVEEQAKNTVVIHARHSAVFSNWIPFRRQIETLGLKQRHNIVVDLSNMRASWTTASWRSSTTSNSISPARGSP
jgi:MFS superfamily sulfate permease-like transporter